jgi:phosphoadenosine phosphosulfate reductase
MLMNKVQQKLALSKKIIIRVSKESQNRICISCSFAKECVVLLDLIREVYNDVVFPVIFIDHKQHFPEVYTFKDELTKQWNLEVHAIPSEKDYDDVKTDKNNCCYWLKIKPLVRIMQQDNYEACLMPENFHENCIELVNPRESTLARNFIYPLRHWVDSDIWRYIRTKTLPYCSLYDKGFKQFSCKPCSQPIFSPEEHTSRENKKNDNEEMIERLRKLGYF